MAGFVDGEGSFYVRLKDATENVRSKNRVSFFFSITQSIRDEKLMTLIAESLGCGIISSNSKYISLKVAKFEDIRTKIIPFFKEYPMIGIKNLNFEDYCIIMDKVESEVHLTPGGFEEIRKIKEGMNFGR